MKYALLMTVLCLVTPFFYGQYDSKGSKETSRFRPGIMWHYTGLNPARLEKVRKYDRLIFDITYNDWTGDLKSFGVKPTSIGLGTNFIFDVPLTKGNTVSFGWGFNHHVTHIRHDNTFFINLANKSTEYTFLQSASKSSLNFHQLSIPLELRFRKESWRHLKLHLGGKIGYVFAMHETSRLENPNGKKTIIKDYNFSDNNPLQYSAHLRFGLRNYALYGEYNFSKLFTNTQSTQLVIFRLGLSISLY
jgi:Outer membrane protein beta-barrel domain